MIAEPLIVVALVYWQLETHADEDLRTKLEEGQAAHRKASGEPTEVCWMPNGREQLALHWFAPLRWTKMPLEQEAVHAKEPWYETRGAAAGQELKHWAPTKYAGQGLLEHLKAVALMR